MVLETHQSRLINYLTCYTDAYYTVMHEYYYNHYTEDTASLVMLIRAILFLVNQLKSTVEVRS